MIKDRATVVSVCPNKDCINYEKEHIIENKGEFIQTGFQCAYCMWMMVCSCIINREEEK